MSRSLYVTLGLLAGLVILGVLWRWLTMREVLTVDVLRQWIATSPAWRDHPAIFLPVMVLYVVALLMMFPLNILVVLTGLIFGPTWGFVYTTLGSLTSSMVSYWLG